jgi:hypothetical protein
MRSIENIRWADMPPPRRGVPVVAVKVGEQLTFLACGCATRVWTHWFNGKSSPCLGRGSQCAGCQLQEARYKAYVPAYIFGQQRIVELTLGAVRAMPELLTQGCVGLTYKLWRRGQTANSPVMIQRVATAAQRTVAFDVIPSLLDMWAFERNDEDAS